MNGPAGTSGQASASSLRRRLLRLGLRWRLVDSKFRHNKSRYVAQCLGATATILLVLLLLDSVKQTVLIASLGASAFIAFAAPRSYASRPRALIGGYCVGTLLGCGLSFVAVAMAARSGLPLHTLQIVGGAVASGLAFFAMVVSDTEHPPAAALAIGFVLNEWDLSTVAVVLSGITALSLVKEIFRARLMDLV